VFGVDGVVESLEAFPVTVGTAEQAKEGWVARAEAARRSKSNVLCYY